jgi:hypothetical protein
LATGDKFNNRKWKDYYQLDGQQEPMYGDFEVGSIVGVLVDVERGIISFFKDGFDLGQAFMHEDIKESFLYPFVQLQVECKMSIFHPFVYPEYRSPILEGSEYAEEDDYYSSNRRDTTRKSWLDNKNQTPDDRVGDGNKLQLPQVSEYQEPSATEKKKQGSQRKSVSFGPMEDTLNTLKSKERQSIASSTQRHSLDSASITDTEIQRRLEHE